MLAAQPQPLPSTWLNRPVRLAYTLSDGGEVIDGTGRLLELLPFGPVVSLAGTRTALSWSTVKLIELAND